MSVPLVACQWRRWSQICLSQEICRSIERGLTRQTYHFLGFVIVFSFCLFVCLFATICLWSVSSSLLLFCFVLLYSVFPFCCVALLEWMKHLASVEVRSVGCTNWRYLFCFLPTQDHKLFLWHVFWHQTCISGKRNQGHFLEKNGKKQDFVLRLGRW